MSVRSRRGRRMVAAIAVIVVIGIVMAVGVGAVTQRWGRYRMPPRYPDGAPDRKFTFARVMYQSVTREPRGQGWYTDYPAADINFMTRLSELTTTPVSFDRHAEPEHVVITLIHDELFDYPFIFMSDVGTVGFTQPEVEQLRSYLLKGGFLWADDFWGPQAWDRWSSEIGRVLPPSQYPIFDIPLDHPIFRGLHVVDRIPQIPSIQFWRMMGGGTTSERGMMSDKAHFRGINDERGRLIVVMSYNTDIADGWEREGEDYEYFYRFSMTAYSFGINVALHAMTH